MDLIHTGNSQLSRGGLTMALYLTPSLTKIICKEFVHTCEWSLVCRCCYMVKVASLGGGVVTSDKCVLSD
jgi:hypothetical protein